MKFPKLIGLTSYAGGGKDTFFRLLAKRTKTIRFALADELKKEISGCCRSLYGVDINDCSREQKNIVRPFLVAHGKIRRVQSQGTYWWKLLDESMRKALDSPSSNGSIFVVTDIRYIEYPNDEIHWLKRSGGCLVHLSKYVTKIVNGEPAKIFDKAPNQEELENNEKLVQKADYKIEWPSYEDAQVDEGVLYPHINNFLHWFEEKL